MNSALDWHSIDTVLLDMDGTLLDRHFDDFFWHQHVPHTYAAKYSMSPAAAKELLAQRYQREEGTLAWTDLDFWSAELGLNIPGMKSEIDHLIKVHPYAIDFLIFCRKSYKRVYLVTNAHDKTLALKMEKTGLGKYFDAAVCAAEIGMAKEEPIFWEKLARRMKFTKERSLLADDTERVLTAARDYGIANLIHIAKPSSTAPVWRSSEFRSITSFKELISLPAPC